MSEHEFTAKQVSKMTDNAQCTPIQLLRYVLHELETGAVKADCCMVITALRDGSAWDMSRYRANLGRVDEIAMLESAKYKAVRDWCS